MATSASVLTPTGQRANRNPWAATAGAPTAAYSAHAPPGGCTHPSNIITTIATATAQVAAHIGSSMSLAEAMPTHVDSRLPPITGYGWANGLAGTANSSTAVAPIGAM